MSPGSLLSCTISLKGGGGEEEIDVGFNLLKIQQLIFCLVI